MGYEQIIRGLDYFDNLPIRIITLNRKFFKQASMRLKRFLLNQCKRHNHQPGRTTEKFNASIVHQLISHA